MPEPPAEGRDPENRYQGPGLNQGMSRLAAARDSDDPPRAARRLEPTAAAAYAAFQAAFARDVPTFDGASLVRACR